MGQNGPSWSGWEYSRRRDVEMQQGALIGGRYRLEQSIGSGGMGEVFRATDALLGRPVAVKLVHPVEQRRRQVITDSFLREARISAAITHPNVVQILDFGVHEQSAPFIVMELLEGESLADMLGRGVTMPIGFVFGLIARVLDALKAAHQAGVIHRDLKPENIFLTRDRGGLNPKLLDFGISKILDASGVAFVTTTHGHIVGTPAYMSPEQARGLKEIDQRSDVYSMGVVLYELLSGELPFFSENPGDLLVLIMTAREQPLRECTASIDPALSSFVQRAMAKSPAERFRDAGEMLDAFLAITATLRQDQSFHAARSARSHGAAMVSVPLSVVQPPNQLESLELSTPEPAPRWFSDRRWLAGLAIALVAFAAGITILLTISKPADATPRFIVVQADPSVDEPTSERTTLEAKLDNLPASHVPDSKPKRAPTSVADSLAQSFRAQRAGIVKCVNTYPEEVQRSPKLTLRLSLGADGSVVQARLSPSELSGGALSSCIEQSARELKFPKQATPMVFDIPLTARKGS